MESIRHWSNYSNQKFFNGNFTWLSFGLDKVKDLQIIVNNARKLVSK